MEERSLEERRSSGAWSIAEERSKVRGRPLPRRVSGAVAPTLQSQVGLPNRIERLLRIERTTERIARRLRGLWTELAQEHTDPVAFADAWRARVTRISYLEVNELVDEHNEWFPIEAKLRWDMELDDYRAPFGIPWRKSHIGADWALGLYPPEHAAALAAT